MCNYCDCEAIDFCSIRGYMSIGSCCEKCGFIINNECTRIEILKKVDDPEEILISKTINNLEKKILEDLGRFKNELLQKKKQKIFILNPK
ncbi:MAG: hypothetical protein EAX96_11285 [Candidatus Lokiarchaeota archaeon]|nr:hypothetical protein [Candidatus Lokiarchaeota archaeon]